jgi:hypothetical protein
LPWFSGFPARAQVQLPRDLLGLPQEEDTRRGQVLGYRVDSRLSLTVAPRGVEAEIAALRTWSRDRVRRFTLGTPWGRLVLPKCFHLLAEELPRVEARIATTLEKIRRLVADSSSDYEGAVRADFLRIWQRLHPDTEPSEATSEQVLHLALEARNRFLRLKPLPIDARPRTTPVPVGMPMLGDPALTGRVDGSHREDLRHFMIKAASAPRRSLVKYQRPELAQLLCRLPDPWMERAIQHRWKAPGGPPEEDHQLSLDDGRTLADVKRLLAGQVAEIHRWYALPFEEVLARYEQLLRGPEVG